MHMKAGKHNWGPLEVSLNGKIITDQCFEFDTVEGWAKVFLRDESGRFARGADGRQLESTIHGKVEIYKKIVNLLPGNQIQFDGCEPVDVPKPICRFVRSGWVEDIDLPQKSIPSNS